MTEKSTKVNESQIDFLKPCPFCNAEMKCVQDVWGVIGCGWKIDGVHSDDCYLKLRYGVNYHTKEDAINAWNKRVNE